MTAVDDFIEALRADEVIDLRAEGVVTHDGALSVTEALAVGAWFDARQAALRTKQP